jgi:hypothetical protein
MRGRYPETTAHPVQLILVAVVVVQTLTLRLLRLVDQVLLFFVTLAHSAVRAGR